MAGYFKLPKKPAYGFGDLLLVKVDTRPEKLERVPSNVIGKNELTGHCYRLVGGELYQYWDSEAG